MPNDTAQFEIIPRRAELVPRRPPLPARPIRRAWLRTLFVPAPVHSYLAPGEQCLIATRRHWSVPLWRLARGGGMMTVIGVLTFLLPGFLIVQLVLLAGVVAHAAWIGWCILDWRVEQIVVSDARIVRVAGLVNITVDAVPLCEITDLSLRCSILGRVFRYASLRIETPGQTRALGRLDFLPSTVCRVMLTGTFSAR